MDTIAELAQEIDNCCPLTGNIKNLLPIVSAYQGIDWRALTKFSTSQYQRLQIISAKEYEIMLLCWDKHQASAMHDHPRGGCIMKILQGVLIEDRYNSKTLEHLNRVALGVNATSYIHNSIAIHKINNDTSEPAVSIHVYAPADYVSTEY